MAEKNFKLDFFQTSSKKLNHNTKLITRTNKSKNSLSESALDKFSNLIAKFEQEICSAFYSYDEIKEVLHIMRAAVNCIELNILSVHNDFTLDNKATLCTISEKIATIQHLLMTRQLQVNSESKLTLNFDDDVKNIITSIGLGESYEKALHILKESQKSLSDSSQNAEQSSNSEKQVRESAMKGSENTFISLPLQSACQSSLSASPRENERMNFSKKLLETKKLKAYVLSRKVLLDYQEIQTRKACDNLKKRKISSLDQESKTKEKNVPVDSNSQQSIQSSFHDSSPQYISSTDSEAESDVVCLDESDQTDSEPEQYKYEDYLLLARNKFDGSPSNYPNFMRKHKSLVKKYNLNPVQQSLLLLKSVDKKTKKFIGNWDLTKPSGYKKAIASLDLINLRSFVDYDYLHELLENAPKLSDSSNDNTKDLINTLSLIFSCFLIRGGVDVNILKVFLGYITRHKLPDDLKRHWQNWNCTSLNRERTVSEKFQILQGFVRQHLAATNENSPKFIPISISTIKRPANVTQIKVYKKK